MVRKNRLTKVIKKIRTKININKSKNKNKSKKIISLTMKNKDIKQQNI